MPFDKAKADRAVNFIKCLKHTKGKWYGVPFNLLPWQEKIVRKVFGTVDKNGNRIIRIVYCEIPKKNGKSEFAAAIALYLLFGDDEPGAEIYSAACDREQAKIVFNIAKQMFLQSPPLKKRGKLIESQNRIIFYKTGSFYRVISAEAYSKDGYNIHGLVFDELHAQPNRQLFDVLTDGAGDAREQPLTVIITTAGYDKKSVCYEQHDYAMKIKNGIIKDKSFLPVVYGIEEGEDWEDEKVWKKVNPSVGQTIKLERLKEAYKKAKEMPAKQNNFRRLRLDEWTQQETRWIDIKKWEACTGIIDEEKLKGRSCYSGLDLASTTDIAAFVMVFPPESEDERIKIMARFWIPAENMQERIKKDRVPYDVWKREGLIKATEGNVIDYRIIRNDIVSLGEKYHIKEIAFDRWGAVQISQDLQDEGFTMVQFGQGFASMAAPTKELGTLILKKSLNHGGNKVLQWMADNMVVKTDPAGNVKPDKAKSTEKIDGIVALVMALDRAMRHKKVGSVYDKRGLVVL